mgnify:CR=1
RQLYYNDQTTGSVKTSWEPKWPILAFVTNVGFELKNLATIFGPSTQPFSSYDHLRTRNPTNAQSD